MKRSELDDYRTAIHELAMAAARPGRALSLFPRLVLAHAPVADVAAADPAARHLAAAIWLQDALRKLEAEAEA